tara:strand:- start:4422 stop:5183 length:762 start_codon:yes stop_codon:yes gene_type:complete
MDYLIIIPSYNREKLLKETTLKLLENVEHRIIILYDKDYPYSPIDNIEQIEAPRGIGNVRNYIREHYNGYRILMIDDDINSIDKLNDDGITFSPINFNEWVKTAWETASKENVKLWGVNLYHNSFFCRQTITTKLCYINGSFTGLDLTDNQLPLKTELDHMEDYDFTIQHFIRDKGVLKFNDVCLKTKCFRKEGGIAEELGGLDKRKLKAKINGEILENRYPNLCSLYKKKKFDVYNIKLKNITYNSYEKIIL